MRVDDAYRKSLETVMQWIHRELTTNRTQVLFRTYSPVHFRSSSFTILACLTFIFLYIYIWGNYDLSVDSTLHKQISTTKD